MGCDHSGADDSRLTLWAGHEASTVDTLIDRKPGFSLPTAKLWISAHRLITLRTTGESFLTALATLRVRDLYVAYCTHLQSAAP